jgi:rhodanese-related sulfurtransferase
MTQLLEFAGNNLILVSAFFFILAMLMVNFAQAAGNKAVLPVEAVQLLNRENALPLDIRARDDFDAGHIINAVHIPAAEIKTRSGELKKSADRPILVYCATGTRSVAAVKELTGAGFEQVYSLKGGISAWRADNLPLS